jgi:hypothetical protein
MELTHSLGVGSGRHDCDCDSKGCRIVAGGEVVVLSCCKFLEIFA